MWPEAASAAAVQPTTGKGPALRHKRADQRCGFLPLRGGSWPWGGSSWRRVLKKCCSPNDFQSFTGINMSFREASGSLSSGAALNSWQHVSRAAFVSCGALYPSVCGCHWCQAVPREALVLLGGEEGRKANVHELFRWWKRHKPPPFSGYCLKTEEELLVLSHGQLLQSSQPAGGFWGRWDVAVWVRYLHLVYSRSESIFPK